MPTYYELDPATAPRRRATTPIDPSFDSRRRRTTIPSQSTSQVQEKGPFQEYYPCYANLKWETLKGYLEGKWQGIKLSPRQESDHWIFEVPQRLTDEDRKNIAALRDSNKRERRERSPE